MHDKLAFTAGILLESYQPTDATQLGYKPYKDKWLCLHIFRFTSLSTWLLYLLSKYYFISTIITTTNQNYHIKHILHIYSTIIAIFRLWF